MAPYLLRIPVVVLIFFGALAGCNRSNNADVEAARSEAQALKSELAKARAEADACKAELAELRQPGAKATPSGRGSDGTTDPTSKPRSGVVRDAEGKEKPFEFIRGVLPGSGSVDPNHLIFYGDGGSTVVPITGLAFIELGKHSYETGRATVLVKTNGGKQQSLKVDLHYAVEVKWKGAVGISRTQWSEFQNGTIAFDK